MIFNNVFDYFYYLGKMDKKNKKPIKKIPIINKELSKQCQAYYNKGYRNEKIPTNKK